MIDWTETLIYDICGRIMTGASIIDMDGVDGLPSSDSIYRRMGSDAEFAARIARAREAQQDHESDAIVHMADRATAEDWQVVKLRMAARQWRAAKLAPKRYGDKVALTGGDPATDAPVSLTVSWLKPDILDDDQLRALASIPVPRE